MSSLWVMRAGNLMVDLRSSTLASMSSLWVLRAGNLPALLRPGPSSLGICLIRVSEQRKASYDLARFFTFFLSLFNFFRSSADMLGRSLLLASSQWAWSPKMHTRNFLRGTYFSLTVPENRLSFWGS